MAGPTETELQAQLEKLLDEGSTQGKIPPAERRSWAGEILAKGNGRITIDGLAWGRRKLRRMKALVTTAETAHRPPAPDDYGRLLAQSFEPGPPQKPPTADWTVWAHIERCKLWEAEIGRAHV